MTKKLNVSLAALALLLTGSALGEPLEGWYASLVRASTDVDRVHGLSGEAAGWALRGGYRFSRNFALEGTVLDGGDIAWSNYASGASTAPTTRGRFETQAGQLVAVRIVPFAGFWELRARAGLAWTRFVGDRPGLDFWGRETVRAFADSDYGYLFGLGFGANLTDRWSVHLDYEHYVLDEETLGIYDDSDPAVDTLALGIHYAFGR